MYDKVVVLLDGSQVAEVVLPYGPPFACSAGARRMALLRVVEPSAPEEHHAAEQYLASRGQQLRQTWDTRLCPAPEIEVSVVPAGDGGVGETIIRFAAESGASVIMLATHGWSGGDWWTTGTVAERVITRATVPVFVVRPLGGRHPGPGAIRRVLVPLDGSLLAERALPYAESLAKRSPAMVTLLYVEEATRPEASTAVVGSATEQDMAEYLRYISDRLRQAGISAVTSIRDGKPGQRIAELARLEKFDLVIMSSHGRTGPGRGAFGGVADRVIHGCHVPVLVIPTRAAGHSERPSSG